MADEQPDKVIDVPGVGSVAFPASMSDAQINAAATKLYQGANPKAKQPPVTSWVDTAVDWLPAAGALVGGTLGASTGVATFGLSGAPGLVAGSAVGGMAGEAAKQNINRMRGKAAPATSAEAASAIGQEGAKDALYAAVGAGGGAIAGMAAPVAGRAAEAAGGALQAAADTPAVRHGSKVLAGLLGLKGGMMREAVASLTIPALVRGSGRALAAGGRMAKDIGERAAAPSGKELVASRLARIPIAERLGQIPNQAVELGTAAAKQAIPAAESFADDVLLLRQSIAKGMPESTAIRILADGSAEYADALKKAWIASIKAKGGPAPEAVQQLLKSGAFKGLPSDAEAAANVAGRNSSGSWHP